MSYSQLLLAPISSFALIKTAMSSTKHCLAPNEVSLMNILDLKRNSQHNLLVHNTLSEMI